MKTIRERFNPVIVFVASALLIVYSNTLQSSTSTDDFQEIDPNFTIDDIQIGDPNVHYLDPEFIDVGGWHKILFTTKVRDEGPLYVADLDPLTGKFLSKDGLDLLVETRVAPIFETLINGPEWAIDATGLAIVYTRKGDGVGIKHVWKAELPQGSPPVLTQLTTGRDHHIHWAATLDPTLPAWRFFYGVERERQLYWSSKNDVNRAHPLPGYVWEGTNNGPRWIPNTPYFVYSKYIAYPSKIELVRVDTTTGDIVVVTDDSILKGDVWGFMAPEFGNEILYSALISPTEIGIYRYLNPSDPFATRFHTITVPNGDPHKYIRSIEIIQTGMGLLRQTYFAFLGADNPNPLEPCDGAIWVANLGADPASRKVWRVDEGANKPYDPRNITYRQEPEWLLGANEAFVYYNAYKKGGIKELRRARTGIRIFR